MLFRCDNHQPINLPKNTTDTQRAMVYEKLFSASHRDIRNRPAFSIDSRAHTPRLQVKPRHPIN